VAQGVIGDCAMAGLLGCYVGLREESEKRVKKGRQKLFGWEFLEIGLSPKKVVKFFWPLPLSIFLNALLFATARFVRLNKDKSGPDVLFNVT
jgi:hypothetical protein